MRSRDHSDHWLALTGAALCMWLLLTAHCQAPPLIDHYNPYHGMLERGYNRGPFIDSANRWAGVPLGSPYCASAGGWVLVRSTGYQHPAVPARARAWITDGATDARRVWLGRDTIPVPSIGIWTRRGGGHWSLVYRVEGDRIYTFEFNTSPDAGGSQWDGKWSGRKVRSVKRDCAPTNAYRLTDFVQVSS